MAMPPSGHPLQKNTKAELEASDSCAHEHTLSLLRSAAHEAYPGLSACCWRRAQGPPMEENYLGLPVSAVARDFESLPAELPSHVVDRLLRHGPTHNALQPEPLDSVQVCIFDLAAAAYSILEAQSCSLCLCSGETAAV